MSEQETKKKIFDQEMVDRLIDPEMKTRVSNLKLSENTKHLILGIVCGLWLNIFGIIVGFCLFRTKSELSHAFWKGWWIGFLIVVGIMVLWLTISLGVWLSR